MPATARVLSSELPIPRPAATRAAHVSIEWVRSAAAIGALERSWRELEANVQERTVLSTFDYNATWYRHYAGSAGDALVGVARRNATVVGIAPLVIRPRRIGRVPLTSVEFVPHEAYAGEFLVEDGRAELIADFIESLGRAIDYDVICLNGIEPDTDRFHAAADASRRQRLAVELTNHPNAVVDLRDGYEGYFRRRTSHFRQAIRRYARLIDKSGTRQIDGVVLTRGIDDIDGALSRMIAITEGSHKLNGQRLADCHRGFLSDLAHRFGSRGMLCLPILTIGERDAAFVFGLVERNTFYDITLSYDDAFAHFRPGTHLIQEMLRHLAAAGVHTVISHGAHEYKRHWASEFVPSTRVFLFAPTARAALTRLVRFRLAPVWQRLGSDEP